MNQKLKCTIFKESDLNEILSKAIENCEHVVMDGEYIFPITTELGKDNEIYLYYMKNGSKLVCKVSESVFEELE